MREVSFEKTIAQYAEICGIEPKIIENVAREFTSHGKKAAVEAARHLEGVIARPGADLEDALAGARLEDLDHAPPADPRMGKLDEQALCTGPLPYGECGREGRPQSLPDPRRQG